MKSTIEKLLGPLLPFARILQLLVTDPGSWRFVPDWFGTLRKERSPLSDGVPWVPFKATRALREYLKPDMRVFEYGSGGSTLFFSRRAKDVFSVEHDPVWHGEVTKRLSEEGTTNCTYLLREPQPLSEIPNGTPEYDCEREFRGWSFDAFIGAIDEHPDGSFDIILVDGRARAACIEKALPKLRAEGWLVLDNSNNSEYEQILERLSCYPRKDYYGVAPYWPPARWKTTVWQIF